MPGSTIALGDVYYLRCTLCNPPKQKFFVVAQAAPILRMFLINSDLSAYERSRPAIVAAKARILAAEHPFLRHDSFVGCDYVSHEYAQALPDILADYPGVYVGSLSKNARAAVAQALSMNSLLSRRHLADIRPLWP